MNKAETKLVQQAEKVTILILGSAEFYYQVLKLCTTSFLNKGMDGHSWTALKGTPSIPNTRVIPKTQPGFTIPISWL